MENAPVLYQIQHGNCFRKLTRILAYMLRFRRTQKSSKLLTIEELNYAENVIFRNIQKIDFQAEVDAFKKNGIVDRFSKVKALQPFMDKDSIIRVEGTRTNKVMCDEKPILLKYDDPIVKLLLNNIHCENMHCGANALMTLSREKYWILKGNTLARSVTHNCEQCKVAKPPRDMVLQCDSSAKPFLNSGVDFCGPVWIHYKIRGKKPQKAYIAIFCCFATNAIHLDLVSELTTQAFIGALNRFIARRGQIETIYNDCDTNFVGTRNLLKELNETIFSKQAQNDIVEFCSKKDVQFKFIPYFRGLWEASIKIAQNLMVKNVETAFLTFDELITLIAGMETILNSRPIASLSNDPKNFFAITPGDLLTGEPLTAHQNQLNKCELKSTLGRWQLVSKLQQTFWTNFSFEHVIQLRHKQKFKQFTEDVRKGALVLLTEDKAPLLQWQIGRVAKLYPCRATKVRIVGIKTETGFVTRTVDKIATLFPKEEAANKHPINEHSPEPEPRPKRRKVAA